MVQSPCSEDNWFAASQEIPGISRNPNFHYRTHKRPPPVSLLGQHCLTLHFEYYTSPTLIAFSHTLRSTFWEVVSVGYDT